MSSSIPSPPWFIRLRVFYRRNGLLLQSVLGILIAAALCREGHILRLNAPDLSLLFLLLTVVFAARFGFLQASALSVSAILGMAYYAAPRPLLRHFAAPHVFVALLIYEAAALIVSRLAAREKVYAAEIEIQRHRTQRLHAVGHSVLLLDLQQSPERQIAEFIQQEFDLDAVAIVCDLPGVAGCAGLWANEEPGTEQRLRALAFTPEYENSISTRRLQGSRGPVGSLLILGEVPSLVLDSLASLAALALERHRSSVNESAAEAARKTEQLRTTVLDGLAHAFKTPLTIIRAASSGLLEAGHLDDAQHQLSQMIDEHAQRLDELASRLLETARIESEDIRLQLETVDLSELAREVVQQLHTESLNASNSLIHSLNIDICAGEIPHTATVDREMIASALKELLTNAVKYSTLGSTITIALSQISTALVLTVHNRGTVILMHDRERIFERFYRGMNHRHAAPGTGIGLSFARSVAEAHGGSIWVDSSEDAGTTFHVSLPIQTSSARPLPSCPEALAGTKG